MNAFLGLFADELRNNGFLVEWVRYIKAKAKPDTLAGFALEGMREVENHQKRVAFTAFGTFMRTRSWTEALFELEGVFTDKEMDTLKDPFADTFYLGMRAILLAQVEDYFEQFMASQNDKKKEIVAVFENTPFADIEGKLRMMIASEVSAQMGECAKNIVLEVKRMLGEGEDWKGPKS